MFKKIYAKLSNLIDDTNELFDSAIHNRKMTKDFTTLYQVQLYLLKVFHFTNMSFYIGLISLFIYSLIVSLVEIRFELQSNIQYSAFTSLLAIALIFVFFYFIRRKKISKTSFILWTLFTLFYGIFNYKILFNRPSTILEFYVVGFLFFVAIFLFPTSMRATLHPLTLPILLVRDIAKSIKSEFEKSVELTKGDQEKNKN